VGGSGKTRLALQAAVELLEEYPDGVWFVDLSPISDPAFLVPTVAAPLNLRDEGGRPLIDILLESVRPRQSLFVLDNCEHLIEACARLADQMLHAAPRLRIFATSREGLGVAGEQNFTVPSLALPDPRNLPSAESLAQVDAVRLFIDRAQAVKIDFSVTEANAPAIAQICQRLDGIPLAIELAAARAKAMSAEQIASRLDDSFRLLTGGSRTALPRQQTLQALIDWSWNLLSMAERDVLQRLAVFAGGWRLEAAEVVCAGEGIDSVEVFDLLAGLVNKSLVVVEADDHPQARYHLLQTIRQYAGDKLIATGGGSACRERHLAYYAGLAAQAEAALHSREQRAWLELLEADHDNLRAALEWALGTNPAEALRICAGLTDFWDTRGYLNEGLGWTRRALEAAGDLPPSPVLVKAVYGAATFTSRLASDDQFKMWIDKGLALARQIDDRGGIAMGLHATGMYAEYFLGDPATAYTYYDEALHTWREIGDRLGIGMALGPQATRALNRRDYDEAERLFNESLALFRQVGDRREAAGALWNLAEVALAQDDLPRARALANESLAEYRALEDQHGIATVLRTLGVVAASHADVDQVTTLFAESCMLFREINDRGCLALSLGAAGKALAEQGAALQAREMALEALTIVKEVNESRGISAALEASVSVLLAQGYWAAAARTFAAVLAYRESVQAELTEHEQADQARELAELHVHLDGEAFEREWREGSRMGMQQAIEFALALLMGGERRE
jgi:predicted ATPase